MGLCPRCPVAAPARGKQRLVRGVQAPSGFPGSPPRAPRARQQPGLFAQLIEST